MKKKSKVKSKKRNRPIFRIREAMLKFGKKSMGKLYLKLFIFNKKILIIIINLNV